MEAKAIWTKIRMWAATILIIISAGSVVAWRDWSMGTFFAVWAILFINAEALALILSDLRKELKG